jgi:hypothetical protein
LDVRTANDFTKRLPFLSVGNILASVEGLVAKVRIAAFAQRRGASVNQIENRR